MAFQNHSRLFLISKEQGKAISNLSLFGHYRDKSLSLHCMEGGRKGKTKLDSLKFDPEVSFL